MPKINWEFSREVAKYADIVDLWADTVMGTGVDLIIGHGFYRYQEGTWEDANELLEQIRYATLYDVITGHALFSYKTLLYTDALTAQAIERLDNYYWTHTVGFTWDSDVKYAIINGIDTTYVTVGTSFDPLIGVSVNDLVDGDMTAQLLVSGSVDMNTIGSYTIVYQVTGSDDKLVTRERQVYVIAKSASLSGVDDISASTAASLDPLNGIEAYDTLWGDITSNVTYSGTYDASTPGVYSLTYIIIGSDGQSVSATRTITIYESSFMVEGANNLTIVMGSDFYPLFDINATYDDINVNQELVIEGTVNTIIVGSYPVTYTYQVDDETYQFTRTIYVTIGTATIDYDGSEIITIDQDEVFDALNTVTATDQFSGDLTNQIVVVGEVNTAVPGTYVIIYTVTGSDDQLFMTYRTITVRANEVIPPDQTGCGTGCSSEVQLIQLTIVAGLMLTGLAFMSLVLLKKKY